MRSMPATLLNSDARGQTPDQFAFPLPTGVKHLGGKLSVCFRIAHQYCCNLYSGIPPGHPFCVFNSFPIPNYRVPYRPAPSHVPNRQWSGCSKSLWCLLPILHRSPSCLTEAGASLSEQCRGAHISCAKIEGILLQWSTVCAWWQK